MYQLAQYYDRIYAFKDYAAETKRLLQIIRSSLSSDGNRLLDMACGTGAHLEHLATHFEIEGADLSDGMLAVACERLPGVPLHLADMTDFDLGSQYDVVTCLFSSIGHVETVDRLGRAAPCLARHLAPGGVLIIEPWFTPAA